MSSTLSRTSRPLQPAQGRFRWLQKPDAQGDGGVIRINGTVYLLSPVRQDAQYDRSRPVVGWKLVKADAAIYDVIPASPCWQCDCGDYVFNRDRAPTPQLRECKHCAALKAALPLAGQSVEPVPDAVPC
jgi:hypothetical protein